MSITSTPPTSVRPTSRPGSSPEQLEPAGAVEAPEGGRTTIADAVVSTIAGIAVREVSGVHALGGGAARAVGALRDRLPGAGADRAMGIDVEVGETQAAVDVSLVAEYGVAIPDLAGAIRRNVVSSIERMTGLEVTEVNIDVTDVHLDEPDAGDVPDHGTGTRVL